MKKKRDNRVKRKYVTLRMFLTTFLVLEVLTTGQGLIYSSFLNIKTMPLGYIFGMAGYWSIVSFIFCLVVNWQRYKTFDRHISKLCEAATKVANGDFSVYLEPIHTADKKDYLDVMFEDFNRMVEELGSIETLKSDFIANVSHEIKTPISVIQNYAQALKEKEMSPNIRKDYTDTIISASEKLTMLVTNILKLNKLENQELSVSYDAYDLCRQLCDCALAHIDQWEAKDIQFEADLEDRCIVEADESMLEIVWNNLLSNAIKFSEPHGAMLVKQRSDADTVTVQVIDHGCGMDEGTLHHIFDKFYQGDTSHSQEGNGLGLALTLRVVELMDGSISVQSDETKGTVFTVKLNKYKGKGKK